MEIITARDRRRLDPVSRAPLRLAAHESVRRVRIPDVAELTDLVIAAAMRSRSESHGIAESECRRWRLPCADRAVTDYAMLLGLVKEATDTTTGCPNYPRSNRSVNRSHLSHIQFEMMAFLPDHLLAML